MKIQVFRLRCIFVFHFRNNISESTTSSDFYYEQLKQIAKISSKNQVQQDCQQIQNILPQQSQNITQLQQQIIFKISDAFEQNIRDPIRELACLHQIQQQNYNQMQFIINNFILNYMIQFDLSFPSPLEAMTSDPFQSFTNQSLFSKPFQNKQLLQKQQSKKSLQSSSGGESVELVDQLGNNQKQQEWSVHEESNFYDGGVAIQGEKGVIGREGK